MSDKLNSKMLDNLLNNYDNLPKSFKKEYSKKEMERAQHFGEDYYGIFKLPSVEEILNINSNNINNNNEVVNTVPVIELKEQNKKEEEKIEIGEQVKYSEEGHFRDIPKTQDNLKDRLLFSFASFISNRLDRVMEKLSKDNLKTVENLSNVKSLVLPMTLSSHTVQKALMNKGLQKELTVYDLNKSDLLQLKNGFQGNGIKNLYSTEAQKNVSKLLGLGIVNIENLTASQCKVALNNEIQKKLDNSRPISELTKGNLENQGLKVSNVKDFIFTAGKVTIPGYCVYKGLEYLAKNDKVFKNVDKFYPMAREKSLVRNAYVYQHLKAEQLEYLNCPMDNKFKKFMDNNNIPFDRLMNKFGKKKNNKNAWEIVCDSLAMKMGYIDGLSKEDVNYLKRHSEIIEKIPEEIFTREFKNINIRECDKLIVDIHNVINETKIEHKREIVNESQESIHFDIKPKNAKQSLIEGVQGYINSEATKGHTVTSYDAVDWIMKHQIVGGSKDKKVSAIAGAMKSCFPEEYKSGDSKSKMMSLKSMIFDKLTIKEKTKSEKVVSAPSPSLGGFTTGR